MLEELVSFECPAYIVLFIDDETVIVNCFLLFSTLEVPKLVEERVVFLFLECLDNSIQISFADVSNDPFANISYLYVYDFLSCLDGAGQL